MSKLLVIVGATASGKSALAMKLAGKFNGEIICADSKTVYRYMDIGTAKPTTKEMLLIPHHLVNIKNPTEPFSAAEFKEMALAAIEDIASRGKLPIMVGGTGLYIDSVLFDYRFPSSVSSSQAVISSEVERSMLSLSELVEQLRQADPEAAGRFDLKNRRRVERALETAGQPRSKSDVMRPETLVFGLALNKEIIHKRIHERVQKMLGEGLIGEVKFVGEKYGWDTNAMLAPAYRAFKHVCRKGRTLGGGFDPNEIEEAAADEFASRDLALAKRQMTWFKRNPNIHWLEAEDSGQLLTEATALVQRFMTIGV